MCQGGRKVKKFISVLLCASLFLSAAACGSTSNSETETGNINSEAEDENSSVSKDNSEKTDKKKPVRCRLNLQNRHFPL